MRVRVLLPQQKKKKKKKKKRRRRKKRKEAMKMEASAKSYLGKERERCS